MAVGAVVACEIHEHQLAFAPRAVERLAILVLHPDQRTGRWVAGHRHESLQAPQISAEHSRHQAEGEGQQAGGGEQASQAKRFVRLDALEAEEPQQVRPRHGEQYHPDC